MVPRKYWFVTPWYIGGWRRIKVRYTTAIILLVLFTMFDACGMLLGRPSQIWQQPDETEMIEIPLSPETKDAIRKAIDAD